MARSRRRGVGWVGGVGWRGGGGGQAARAQVGALKHPCWQQGGQRPLLAAPPPRPLPRTSCSDLWPDPREESCYAAYNHTDALPSFVERNGRWHHLAVTWTAANNGLTTVGAQGWTTMGSRQLLGLRTGARRRSAPLKALLKEAAHTSVLPCHHSAIMHPITHRYTGTACSSHPRRRTRRGRCSPAER